MRYRPAACNLCQRPGLVHNLLLQQRTPSATRTRRCRAPLNKPNQSLSPATNLSSPTLLTCPPSSFSLPACRYENTERRQAALAAKGIFEIGMGVSGGEEGARNGERRRAAAAWRCRRYAAAAELPCWLAGWMDGWCLACLPTWLARAAHASLNLALALTVPLTLALTRKTLPQARR